jgi:hypothetical protein
MACTRCDTTTNPCAYANKTKSGCIDPGKAFMAMALAAVDAPNEMHMA